MTTSHGTVRGRVSTHRTFTNHEPSHWLRSQLGQMVDTWVEQGFKGCRHLQVMWRPTVVTALWDPARIACACASVFTLHGNADNACDRCGLVDETVRGLLFEATLRRRRFLVALGLCQDCLHREGIE